MLNGGPAGLAEGSAAAERSATASLNSALRLVQVVQQLSLARDLSGIATIVRHAARELTGADGASFVLREGENCHYVDEDAISPLWKGRRFPLSACVSGWVMTHRTPVAIEDIYADPRVPHEAYRPTFVKSMAMVPIRSHEPIGAIGNYWADHHTATATEMKLLQALADSTSIAMENVQVYAELEQRVRQRTLELEQANQSLEAFSYTAAHDLRAPVRHITAFTEFLLEEGECRGKSLDYVRRIATSAERLSRIIEDTLTLTRVSRSPMTRRPVDLTRLAEEIVATIRSGDPQRAVTVDIAPDLHAQGDLGLLRTVLENLLGNAWKFTARRPDAHIAFGADQSGGRTEFFVRDNGAGFDSASATRLFQPFERLHPEAQFAGSGVGLATVHRIVSRHGGSIRAESAVDQGATFYFTLE